MKAGVLKVVLLAAVLALVLSACAPSSPSGGQSPNGAAPTAAGGVTAPTEAAAAPTTAGDAGAANCVGVDSAALVSGGQALYTERCASCHGAQGEGMGDFPALAGNPVAIGSDVTALVTRYFAVEGHPKEVTPDDLASLFSYVRGSFGNTGTVVCPADITIPAVP